MTTSVAHDYPDWGRQSSTADILAINISQSLSADTDFGSTFVGLTPYLYTFFDAGNAANGEVTLNWSLTDGGIVIGADTIVVRAVGTRAQLSVPVRAAFVNVSIRLSAYPNTTIFRAFNTAVPSQQQMANDTNRLILQDAVSVGAGATVVVNAGEVRTGWCYWQAVLRDATIWLAQINVVDFGGTSRILDNMGSGFSTVGRMIFIPPLPVRLTVTNNDAVAQLLYATVLFRPFDT